jgi:hypothetical protein
VKFYKSKRKEIYSFGIIRIKFEGTVGIENICKWPVITGSLLGDCE